MNDDDLKAIADLSEIDPWPQRRLRKPLPPDDPQMKAGAAIYRDQCSACHGLDGKGVPNLFPVARAIRRRSVRTIPTTILRIILRGARSVATARSRPRPACLRSPGN